MTSKNISVRDDIYEQLTRLKQKNQSYSDVIENLINEGTKGSFSRLMKYFGTWSGFPEEVDQSINKIRQDLNKNLSDRIQESE
ncbi:MAG TPA: antitoxin VapB family protein [Candidatus Lokiarchaeia archaeon]|nr:antitoxin VapB family protein [Candidatus Lokiarchaeia archaeon]